MVEKGDSNANMKGGSAEEKYQRERTPGETQWSASTLQWDRRFLSQVGVGSQHNRSSECFACSLSYSHLGFNQFFSKLRVIHFTEWIWFSCSRPRGYKNLQEYI